MNSRTLELPNSRTLEQTFLIPQSAFHNQHELSNRRTGERLSGTTELPNYRTAELFLSRTAELPNRAAFEPLNSRTVFSLHECDHVLDR